MKVNGKDDIPYIMENKKCLKPPTSSKSFDSSDMVGEMAYPSYKGEYAWFIWCIMVGLRMGSPSSAVACYGRVFMMFSPVQEVEETKFMAMVVEKIHGKTDTLWLFNMAMENGP